MLFQSPLFIVFFAAIYLLLVLLRMRSARHWVLLVGSYFFYSCWDVRFLLLIFLSTILDYALGLLLESASSPRKRRLLIAVSVCSNLGILGFFKYFNFFVESAAALAASFGIVMSDVTMQITLPVGVSFFTFQALTYTIDVYRREIPAERSFVRFALFISFFPQLVAGPIVRGREFLPQLTRDRPPRLRDVPAGLSIFALGLFQKIAIADNLGRVADPIFAAPELYGGSILWLGLFAYAFQIYCDFAGYSSMAIGTARMLGYRLPRNFNRPYRAGSLREFWKRWHMTLSRFLRDYLYVSLGGNRGGMLLTCRNIMITMILGGLWHGASWRFAAWGLLHGLALVAERVFARFGTTIGRFGLNHALTLLVVFNAWLLFRAFTFSDARLYFTLLLTGNTPRDTLPEPLILLAVILIALCAFGCGRASEALETALVCSRAALKIFVSGFVIAMAYGLSAGEERVFIYFQF